MYEGGLKEVGRTMKECQPGTSPGAMDKHRGRECVRCEHSQVGKLFQEGVRRFYIVENTVVIYTSLVRIIFSEPLNPPTNRHLSCALLLPYMR